MFLGICRTRQGFEMILNGNSGILEFFYSPLRRINGNVINGKKKGINQPGC